MQLTTSVSPGASAPAQQTSAVPERFRSVTDAKSGHSAVPADFRSVTKPQPRPHGERKTTAAL
jgi:hypothetical protein